MCLNTICHLASERSIAADNRVNCLYIRHIHQRQCSACRIQQLSSIGSNAQPRITYLTARTISLCSFVPRALFASVIYRHKSNRPILRIQHNNAASAAYILGYL